MDGGVEWGRGGLCLAAGWEPREDLAEIRRYLWLEEGRKVWLLLNRDSEGWALLTYIQDLQTPNCGLKSTAEFYLSHSSHSFTDFMSVFYAVGTNPIWSRLSSRKSSCLFASDMEFDFSLSVCGGLDWVLEDRVLSVTRSLDSLRGVFVYVGLAVTYGCSIWIHNLQDSSMTELDCGYETFSLFKPLQITLRFGKLF